MDLLPRESGKNLLRPWSAHRRGGRRAMTYSYTQISQYLRCPRSYRHRYLDGWQEKDSRAALLFGRCFEKALSAYFRREDSAAVLFKEWGAHRDTQLEYANGDGWERMARQGVQLLERLAQDDRIRIRQQRRDLGQLVEHSVGQIQAGQFLPHSGIRFPQNGCVSCPYLGLCLGNRQLIDAKLIRRPGASDLDWLDQLDD